MLEFGSSMVAVNTARHGLVDYRQLIKNASCLLTSFLHGGFSHSIVFVRRTQYRRQYSDDPTFSSCRPFSTVFDPFSHFNTSFRCIYDHRIG
jgi:hypothetical protein